MLSKIFEFIGSYANTIGWAILVVVGLTLLWGNK
jgi:putative Mn2+ efflux pump MntP